MDLLEKGLIDFGVTIGDIDLSKYQSLLLPAQDRSGVLMRRDSPLAAKDIITAKDLIGQPLIVSSQGLEKDKLPYYLIKDAPYHIVATYNLLFNASLLVSEGLGYALCFDRLINTQGSSLCFRPFFPRLEARGRIVWKKYQVFSKAAGLFLQCLRELLEAEM